MARLNLFQKTMRVWDESMPYNAVHAARVPLAVDCEKLLGAIGEALERYGYPCGREEILIAEHPADGRSEQALRDATEEELNRRFANPSTALPFRFFVIPEGSEGFILGICYFHLVASGDSICWLLGDIVTGYSGGGREAIPIETGKAPPTDRSLLRRHWRYLPAWIATLPGNFRKSRGFARLPRRHAEGARTGFRVVPVGPEGMARIQEARGRTGASFHDVLLALVFLAIADALPGRLQHKRRRNIGVGSVVNIRRFFGPEHAHRFGLFLSLFAVSHPVPPGTSFDELVTGITDQTREIKRRLLFLRNLAYLAAALLWKKFLSPAQARLLYAKFFPLAASVTSFSVDRCHEDRAQLPVDGYWRAQSASPATPLVLSCTTFSGDAKVVVTYDDSVYTERDVDAFVSAFSQELTPIPSLQ